MKHYLQTDNLAYDFENKKGWREEDTVQLYIYAVIGLVRGLCQEDSRHAQAMGIPVHVVMIYYDLHTRRTVGNYCTLINTNPFIS